jgi:hypothetical protein
LFIVLPLVFYAFSFKCIEAARDARARMAPSEVPFENAVFTMHRPANWQSFETPGPGILTFHIPDIGTFMVIVKDSEGQAIDLERTAQGAAQSMAAKFDATANELDTFPTWGEYSGHGIRTSMKGNGKDMVARIFCASLPDGRILCVYELGQANAEGQLQPQFEIVRKTLQVKPTK